MSVARRALVFYVLATAFAWGWWLWLLARGLQVLPGGPVSHLPGLMGPAIAALLVAGATEGRAGLHRLLASLVPRRLDRPLILALMAFPPVLAAAALWAAHLAGAPWPEVSSFFAYPGLPAAYATALGVPVVLLLNGLGEELGWRGYLFPLLLPRLGAFRAALVVAGLWLVWHLPLFWLVGSMQALIGPMLAGWAIGLVLGSFALSHLWMLSGQSVGTVLIWHVLYNFCVATEATSGLAAAVVSSAVMLWGGLVAVAWAKGRWISASQA